MGVPILLEELSYVRLYIDYISFIILLKMSVIYIYICMCVCVFSLATLAQHYY